jgi:hypothetical protein
METAREAETMGDIIKFPADASARRLGVDVALQPRKISAQILILPVIRIERHVDDKNGHGPEEGAAPNRRRKRRARS